MKLGLIYARSRNGVVGNAGTLPWRIPEDLAHFKAKTMGAPVIMGRRTWDSVPPKFRPLPGRRNIVITRATDWQADGALRASSIEEAVQLCADAPVAWITGGAEIWKQSMHLAHFAEVTEIDAEFEGDTFAPVLGGRWRETARERHRSASGLAFDFVTYENKDLIP